MSPRLLIAVILAALLCAGIPGWLLAVPESSPAAKQAEDAWTVPKRSFFAARSNDLNNLRNLAPWGQEAETFANDYQLAEDWRLTGIVGGKRPVALLLANEKGARVQRLAVGETLGERAILKRIDKTAVVVELDGVTHELSLYAPRVEKKNRPASKGKKTSGKKAAKTKSPPAADASTVAGKAVTGTPPAAQARNTGTSNTPSSASANPAAKAASNPAPADDPEARRKAEEAWKEMEALLKPATKK